MAFHISDRVRLDTGIGKGNGNRLSLPFCARRRESDPVGAVVVDAATTNNGIDPVPVAQGIIEPLEQHHARPTGEHSSTRFRVKGPADPVAGYHATFLVDVSALLRDSDGHTSRQRHVAAIGQQVLACLRNREQ